MYNSKGTMNIISFIDGHTASAALFCDGNVEACVSEERFSRKKNSKVEFRGGLEHEIG